MNGRYIKAAFFIVALLIAAYGEKEIAQQQVRLVNVMGTVTYRASGKGAWKPVNSDTELSKGCEVKVAEDSKLELGFEPAVTVALSENSSFVIKKILKNSIRKSVRTHLDLKEGFLWIEMPSYMTHKLHFTIETNSTIVYLRKAVVKVVIDNNFTIVEVYRGAVKVRQKNKPIEKVIYANNSAVIHPLQEVINVSEIADTLNEDINHGIKSNIKQKEEIKSLSIAMLAIYSPIVSKANLESVSDYVAQEIETQATTEVLFLEDVRSMLKAEGMDKMLHCNSDSCLSKIGHFLGVDVIVIGRLGQIGKKYIFNLKMIDALRDKTLKRVNVTVDEDVGNILQEIPNMVGQLVEAKKKTTNTKLTTSARRPKTFDKSKMYKDMAWIFSGTFTMGAETGEGDNDETPKHEVTIEGFFIDKFEVTREDYNHVMGYNPSVFKGCKTCPVDNVTWTEAKEYCKRVNKRLPTEGEWEYACKAGAKTIFHYGNNISSDNANFDGRKPYGGAMHGVVRNKPVPVGSFKSNAWQLYDMHGNMGEWCTDWYSTWYYNKSPKNNPQGPMNGRFKVVRGGSWKGDGASVRSTNRIAYAPFIRLNTIGFRCVKDYKE